MKKEKLKLDVLKVQSFVTSMEKQQKQTVEGGMTPVITSVMFISIDKMADYIISATQADDNGDSQVICNSDMCYSHYGWFCAYADVHTGYHNE